MGYLKNRRIEQGEMDFSAPGCHAVCPTCVGTPGLARFVENNADESECTFCQRPGDAEFAANTDVILQHISSSVRAAWSLAIEELAHDSESVTGYAGKTIDFEDLLYEEGVEPANQHFHQFLIDAFRDAGPWCNRSYAALDEGDALNFGWENLVDTVKHKQRFFFDLESHQDDREPGVEVLYGRQLLARLAELIRQYKLVKTLHADTHLYRCRVHPADEAYSTAQTLGSPPPHLAKQSRMSPAGIPMFYAASSAGAALAETPNDHQQIATIATFRVASRCRVIDLARIPEPPDIFEDAPSTTIKRHELGFLHGFSKAVSGPVDDPVRVHIDYVPSQVVAEYLRHVFRDDHGRPVHGIRWRSAKQPKASCVVLFLQASQCLDLTADAPDEPMPFVQLIAAKRLVLS